MNLAFVKKTYEKLGEEDPFYGVLTVDQFRHNQWDPREFFRTGEREIREVLRYAGRLGLKLNFQRALDFGCGTGRLSQALGDHFQHVTGVDIAESMVRTAWAHNRHGKGVQYLVNTTPDLKNLDSDCFDFIYSSITLQHIPPEAGRKSIEEFVRVLRPGGIAIFQVPNGKPFAPGSWRARIYVLHRQHLRRLWKVVRGRPPYEIHYVPRQDIERLIHEAGGTILDVVDVDKKRGTGKNFRYCMTK
jgi:SAM-dependent methyltransferase